MNSFAVALTGPLVLIPLAAQWVGLMAMGKQRTVAWWTMTIGAVLQTMGILGSVIFIILMFTHLSFGTSGWKMRDDDFEANAKMTMVAGLVAAGGALGFAAGFALHGFRRRVAREREHQLETMAATMAEELRVMRGR